MIKLKLFFVLSFALILTVQPNLYSQLYLKIGANYLNPINKMADINKPAYGFNVGIQNCSSCKYWYGLKISSFNLQKADNLTLSETYYTKAMFFTPNVRYNFLNKTCRSYNNRLIPYIEGGLIFSSMDKTDNEAKFGFGGELGFGLSYGFSFLKTCWNLDLNGQYQAPNAILSASSRQSVQTVDVSLNLGVRLW
jgi:hypothetical protein